MRFILVFLALIGLCGFNAPALAQQSSENTDSKSDFKNFQWGNIFSFSYPKDWSFSDCCADPPSEISIYNVIGRKPDKLLGSIKVDRPFFHENETSPDTILKKYIRELSYFNSEMVWKAELSDLKQLKISPKVKAFSGYIYEQRSFETSPQTASQFDSIEIWFTALTLDNYSVLIELVTPAKDSNPELWEKNTQAYKNMIESIQFHQLECPQESSRRLCNDLSVLDR